MANAQSAWVWYELMTTDVAAAKSFYGQVVGWNTHEMPMPGTTYTVLQAGEAGVGGMMPLTPDMTAMGMRPCWVGYIYSADVDAGAEQVQKLGGRVCRAPENIPTVGRFAVVSDPQGAVFHLFKPSQPAARVPAEGAGHIGWHELHTNDWPKAFEFYTAMFGWTRGDAISMGPMGTYQLFKLGEQDVGAMFNSPAAEAHRFWLYYFVVTDIDAAAARLSAAGGKVMHGPMQVPDGRWIVQATDPQGAWFAVLGSKK